MFQNTWQVPTTSVGQGTKPLASGQSTHSESCGTDASVVDTVEVGVAVGQEVGMEVLVEVGTGIGVSVDRGVTVGNGVCVGTGDGVFVGAGEGVGVLVCVDVGASVHSGGTSLRGSAVGIEDSDVMSEVTSSSSPAPVVGGVITKVASTGDAFDPIADPTLGVFCSSAQPLMDRSVNRIANTSIIA